MVDLKFYPDSDLNGERLHFGAEGVFCDHETPPARNWTGCAAP